LLGFNLTIWVDLSFSFAIHTSKGREVMKCIAGVLLITGCKHNIGNNGEWKRWT